MQVGSETIAARRNPPAHSSMHLVPLTRRALLALACLVSAAAVTPALHAQEKSIVMASTTSTEQSGLFAHLLPAFKAATGTDAAEVEAPLLLLAHGFDQIETLGVADDLGGVEGVVDLFDQFLLVGGDVDGRAGELGAGGDALLLLAGEDAGLDGGVDGADDDGVFGGVEQGPLAGAFLAKHLHAALAGDVPAVRVDRRHSFHARIGAGREAIPSQEGLRIENLSGVNMSVRNIAALHLPAKDLGRSQLMDGDSLELDVVFSSHLQTYTVHWRGNFTLRR